MWMTPSFFVFVSVKKIKTAKPEAIRREGLVGYVCAAPWVDVGGQGRGKGGCTSKQKNYTRGDAYAGCVPQEKIPRPAQSFGPRKQSPISGAAAVAAVLWLPASSTPNKRTGAQGTGVRGWLVADWCHPRTAVPTARKVVTCIFAAGYRGKRFGALGSFLCNTTTHSDNACN